MMQGVLLGAALMVLPSLLALAWMMWRAPIAED